MKSVTYGIVCLVLGILAFIFWWPDFFRILKGLIPLALIIMGLLALSTGIGMVRDNKAKEEDGSTEKSDKE